MPSFSELQLREMWFVDCSCRIDNLVSRLEGSNGLQRCKHFNVSPTVVKGFNLLLRELNIKNTAVAMFSGSPYMQRRASHDTRVPFQIQTAIVKSSVCYSTVKAGYRFDILRNETASTDKSSEHQGPWSAPHLMSVLVLCLLLCSSLNFAL